MHELLIITISAFLISLGIVIEKKALGKLKKFKFIDVLKKPFWNLGFLLTVAGGFMYLWALSLTEITIVQPLMNLTIPFVAIIGFFSLKEKLTKYELIGMAFLFVGAILLSLVIV